MPGRLGKGGGTFRAKGAAVLIRSKPEAGTARVAGHFGELLQGRLGAGGPVALVTLPCPVLSVQATVLPSRGLTLHQTPARVLTPARLARFLDLLDLPRRGRFRLQLAMPPGGGAGASTAALMALALAAEVRDAERMVAACLAIEGASDPLHLAAAERVLWASRLGQVITRLPALPAMEIIGGFWGGARRTDPQDHDFPDISDLVAEWPLACANLVRVAELASQSARRTLDLRGPPGDPTAALARRLGALGYVIAHTGSARGLIFAPGTRPEAVIAGLRQAGFLRITRFRCGSAT